MTRKIPASTPGPPSARPTCSTRSRSSGCSPGWPPAVTPTSLNRWAPSSRRGPGARAARPSPAASAGRPSVPWAELMARDLSDLDVAVRMVDGIAVAGQSCVAALVITTDGRKVPVGLYLGDTQNATIVTALLADLRARGPSRRRAACSSTSTAPRPSRPASAASSARRPRSSAAPSASGATWLTTCPQGARRPDRPSLGPGIQRPRPGSRSRPDEGDRRQP